MKSEILSESNLDIRNIQCIIEIVNDEDANCIYSVKDLKKLSNCFNTSLKSSSIMRSNF